MRGRKWKPGRALTPMEAFGQILQGRPVYFRHKWTHNGWARSWQINMVTANAGAGHIFEAIETDGADDECDSAN